MMPKRTSHRVVSAARMPARAQAARGFVHARVGPLHRRNGEHHQYRKRDDHVADHDRRRRKQQFERAQRPAPRQQQVDDQPDDHGRKRQQRLHQHHQDALAGTNDHTSGTSRARPPSGRHWATTTWPWARVVEGLSQEPLLEADGHLRGRGRRPERLRPRRRPPHRRPRDQPVHQATRGRLDDVQHVVDAPHDGADPRASSR